MTTRAYIRRVPDSTRTCRPRVRPRPPPGDTMGTFAAIRVGHSGRQSHHCTVHGVPHAPRTMVRDHCHDHRRRGSSSRGAGRGPARSHSRPDPEGRPGRGSHRVRSRSANRGFDRGQLYEPGPCPHSVPDAGGGWLGTPRPQRPARAALPYRRERDGADHLPGHQHPGPRLRHLDVAQRNRSVGRRVSPAVRRRRHAGVRQVLHGVQRPVGQRARGLPGRRRREPRDRDPGVDGRRSARERVQWHLTGGLPGRPVHPQPRHRRHRVQSGGCRGIGGLRAPLCRLRGRRRDGQ